MKHTVIELKNGQFEYRLIFDLGNKNKLPRKNLLTVVKLQNLVEKCCNVWKIYTTLQTF